MTCRVFHFQATISDTVKRCAIGLFVASIFALRLNAESPFTVAWQQNMLTIHGGSLPGGAVDVWYMEAYCRAGSTARAWNETVIGHRTRLVSVSDDRRRLKLQCRLEDGVVVDHTLRAVEDGVEMSVRARNPTRTASAVHWAQPCIRVDQFTGATQETYLKKSFIFLDGRLARLPTTPWATAARYTPGQVWCPAHVPRQDVNPRPLSVLVPSNGLIGCFSQDERMLLATAWQPYQELFQGVIVCLHADVRIAGLNPGEEKMARGKIFLMDADVARLRAAYEGHFRGQARKSP